MVSDAQQRHVRKALQTWRRKTVFMDRMVKLMGRCVACKACATTTFWFQKWKRWNKELRLDEQMERIDQVKARVKDTLCKAIEQRTIARQKWTEFQEVEVCRHLRPC